MKGTITWQEKNYKQERRIMLWQIKFSRNVIRLIHKCVTRWPDLSEVGYDIIEYEQTNIETYFNQLVELERRYGKN